MNNCRCEIREGCPGKPVFLCKCSGLVAYCSECFDKHFANRFEPQDDHEKRIAVLFDPRLRPMFNLDLESACKNLQKIMYKNSDRLREGSKNIVNRFTEKNKKLEQFILDITELCKKIIEPKTDIINLCKQSDKDLLENLLMGSDFLQDLGNKLTFTFEIFEKDLRSPHGSVKRQPNETPNKDTSKICPKEKNLNEIPRELNIKEEIKVNNSFFRSPIPKDKRSISRIPTPKTSSFQFEEFNYSQNWSQQDYIRDLEFKVEEAERTVNELIEAESSRKENLKSQILDDISLFVSNPQRISPCTKATSANKSFYFPPEKRPKVLQQAEFAQALEGKDHYFILDIYNNLCMRCKTGICQEVSSFQHPQGEEIKYFFVSKDEKYWILACSQTVHLYGIRNDFQIEKVGSATVSATHVEFFCDYKYCVCYGEKNIVILDLHAKKLFLDLQMQNFEMVSEICSKSQNKH